MQYVGPSLFASGANWTGVVFREPLTPKTAKGRADDFRYLIQVGTKKDGRPKLSAVRGAHLKSLE